MGSRNGVAYYRLVPKPIFIHEWLYVISGSMERPDHGFLKLGGDLAKGLFGGGAKIDGEQPLHAHAVDADRAEESHQLNIISNPFAGLGIIAEEKDWRAGLWGGLDVANVGVID